MVGGSMTSEVSRKQMHVICNNIQVYDVNIFTGAWTSRPAYHTVLDDTSCIKTSVNGDDVVICVAGWTGAVHLNEVCIISTTTFTGYAMKI